MDRLSGSAKNKARDALKQADAAGRPPSMAVLEANSPFFEVTDRVSIVDPRYVPPSVDDGAADGGRGEEKKSGRDSANSTAAPVAKAKVAEDKRTAVCSTPRGPRPVAGEAVNVALVEFRPQQAGEYPCRVVVTSPAEIRVYHFEVTVKAPGMIQALEFSAAARQQLAQALPVVNNSSTDWSLRAVITEAPMSANNSPRSAAEDEPPLTGRGGQEYPKSDGDLARLGPGKTWTGPGSMVVRAGEEARYPLSFCPKWICSLFGKLVLTNAQTGDTF